MALIKIIDHPTWEELQHLKMTAPKYLFTEIDNCTSYEYYVHLQFKIESLQPSFHEIINPSQTDIKKHLKRFL